MTRYPLPENEEQRLAALQATGLFGTPVEERFDRFTRLARRMFDMPIALVTLVGEDTAWVKSCATRGVREVPRERTFCAHAILQDDLMVVMDAHRDERFAANPMVTGEPYLRFYAGCPVRAVDGSRLGTICLFDYQPRIFSTQDRDLLRDLGHAVQGEIAAVQLATTDELTQLANRRGLGSVGTNALALCRRFAKHAVLLYLDLNDFKTVNDDFGHAEGDRALREFSAILWDVFRESDVVARVGGDEFCVLATGASPEACRAPLARFAARIDARNRSTASAYPLTYSEGWAVYDADRHPTIEDLVRDADLRMYANKQAADVSTTSPDPCPDGTRVVRS